jgi:Amt family ammonium transporter
MTTKRAITTISVLALGATPALAEAAPPTIDAGDTAWMIAATGLVLMMTIPGLALFYCGMVRKKNVLATMAQSLLCTALCSILWVAIGYSLAFNGDGALIGNLDKFMLQGIGMNSVAPSTKIPEMLFMVYQMTFAIITVALVAGSVADRMRFSAFVWFAALWLLVVYVPIAHWVWGGGWLTPDATTMKPGILDFAGGTVVHLNAGVAGLVAAYIVGNRQGYGSENFANSRAVFAIVATHLAASTGALTWMALEWWTRGKPSVLGMISGAVAGLGTITPASGFVLPWHGIVIGLLAGAICFWACTRLKQKLGYDDSLDVFGVHGIGGVTGTLLCGVFAVAAVGETAGLIEGNPGQLLYQVYGIAAVAVWSGVATVILLKVIEFMVPLRVSKQSEIEGLDVTQHGEALQ